MVEPTRFIRLDSESDEYVVVNVVAVKPTWRDCWAIVRGRYEPLVVRVERLTMAGLDRVLKQTWTPDRMHKVLYSRNPLLDMLEPKGSTDD